MPCRLLPESNSTLRGGAAGSCESLVNLIGRLDKGKLIVTALRWHGPAAEDRRIAPRRGSGAGPGPISRRPTNGAVMLLMPKGLQKCDAVCPSELSAAGSSSPFIEKATNETGMCKMA